MALERENGERGHRVVAENAEGRGPFIVLCDHASNRIPREFGGLGLTDERKQSHIAWDPGALAVSRRLASRLDAPLIWPDASRLVIDCNRAHDAPDLIPETGEGQTVPGNTGIGPDERDRRIARYHVPYHRKIDELIDRRLKRGQVNALVAVHSFTPVLFGVPRPWPVGIIHDKDCSLADHVVTALKSDPDLTVGVNEPYSPADGVYHTLSVHGDGRGIDSVMIEIRNDEIASDEKCLAWADRLSNILAGAGLRAKSSS